MSIKKYCVLPWLVVLALMVSACSKEEPKQAAFQVQTDNGMFDSQQHSGSVIYLDFWASWCAPCRESFPWMNEMREKYADQGLQIIAVSIDNDAALAKQFAKQFGAEFLIGYDEDGELANQFEVRVLPQSVLIDREGNLVTTHVGFKQEEIEKYEKSISDALN